MANLREVWTRKSSATPVDGTGNTVGFVFINLGDVVTANGDNTVYTNPGGGKKIRVLGYSFGVGSTGGLVTLKDTTAGTPIKVGEFDLAANGGAVFAGGHDCPAGETGLNKDLIFNMPTSVRVKGHITLAVV
jgi:hypothetical protein